MRRKEVRLRKAQQARRYRRRLDRAREDPHLLFVERAALQEGVAVERSVTGGRALAGFWRGEDFYQIRRVAEVRREQDAIYYRVITDRGCFDLRLIRQMDPWTLRLEVAWELTAELDAIEVTRPF